jgi:hypothetical protein
MGWFDEGGSGQTVDVVALLDSKSSEMLWAMVNAGALISLGLTSDGGALGLTVTVDGKWRREYFRESGQMELWCEEAMAPVLDACEARRASSEQRGRTRGTRGR